MLEGVFAQAIQEVYAEKHPLRAEADGESIMYCFCAARDREAPSVASEFVRDVSTETRGATDVCALLVVSVPEMRVRSEKLHIVGVSVVGVSVCYVLAAVLLLDLCMCIAYWIYVCVRVLLTRSTYVCVCVCSCFFLDEL